MEKNKRQLTKSKINIMRCVAIKFVIEYYYYEYVYYFYSFNAFK